MKRSRFLLLLSAFGVQGQPDTTLLLQSAVGNTQVQIELPPTVLSSRTEIAQMAAQLAQMTNTEIQLELPSAQIEAGIPQIPEIADESSVVTIEELSPVIADDNIGIIDGDDLPATNVLEGHQKPLPPPDLQRAHHPTCPAECLQQMVGDGWCNTECSYPECGNDVEDCQGWCAPDCKGEWLGDRWCDKDCFRAECEWDRGDCDHLFRHGDIVFPPPDAHTFDYTGCSCLHRLLHNGNCDAECDTKECNWDGGDCRHSCAPGCRNAWLGDEECDTICFSEACGYDKGDCDECSPGCRPDRIGNGICDGPCMNDKCFWDMGDCAGVCKVYPVDYSTLPFEYNHCRTDTTGDGFCDCFCMNNDCHNDRGDCAGMEAECEGDKVDFQLNLDLQPKSKLQQHGAAQLGP